MTCQCCGKDVRCPTGIHTCSTRLAIVTGCGDCPMRDPYWHCMRPGLDADIDRYIKQETPDWCPLRTVALTLRLKVKP